MEGMLAEVRMFAGNFAPRSWAFCDGQLLSINANQALFSLLGTIYGGDGRTTFALPDLRGRVPIGPGNGPGLSSYREGQKGGVESVILNQTQIPSHTHSAAGTLQAVVAPANSNNPNAKSLGIAADNLYASGDANGTMGENGVAVTVSNTGGNLGHTNMQPWIAIYYIICLQGIFPSRS